jgi:hypothetical protein
VGAYLDDRPDFLDYKYTRLIINLQLIARLIVKRREPKANILFIHNADHNYKHLYEACSEHPLLPMYWTV